MIKKTNNIQNVKSKHWEQSMISLLEVSSLVWNGSFIQNTNKIESNQLKFLNEAGVNDLYGECFIQKQRYIKQIAYVTRTFPHGKKTKLSI